MSANPPTLPRRPGSGVHTGRILQTIISVAVLVASLFVAFSPRMFSGNLNSLISGLLAPQSSGGIGGIVPAATRVNNAVRIGIVSGHWGNVENVNDPGAVCPDGTNEHDVNLKIASLVRQKLEAYGYNVDLLQEWDARLEGYSAAVLLSIHADTCDVIDDQATGFKVAASSNSHDRNAGQRFVACLDDRYAAATGLHLHSGSVTLDMTNYHAFDVISPATTAAIIETGFLNLDREILVNHPDVVADGIVGGIQCYINNESVKTPPAATP